MNQKLLDQAFHIIPVSVTSTASGAIAPERVGAKFINPISSQNARLLSGTIFIALAPEIGVIILAAIMTSQNKYFCIVCSFMCL